MNPPDTSPDECKPKKRAGRKRVAKGRKVKRPKERGKYQKSLKSSGLDLAECVFSDDEVLEEYLDTNGVEESSTDDQLSLVSSDASVSDSVSVASVESVASSSMSELDAFPLSPPTPDSRPTSAPLFRTPKPPSSTGSSRSTPVCSTPEQVSPLPQVVSPDVTIEDSDFQKPSLHETEMGLNMFKNVLPKPWIVIADQNGFHLLLPSTKSPICIQREIFISFAGSVLIYMHSVLLPSFYDVFNISNAATVQFTSSSMLEFCQFGLSLVKKFLMFVTCVGANDMDTKQFWHMIEGGVADNNPYHEERYTETCRSDKCLRIVELGPKIFRCAECKKLIKKIRARKEFMLSPEANPLTKNECLTREQSLHKMAEQQKAIRKKDKLLAYYRMKRMLDTEGVNIDEDLSKEFSEILLSSPNLTENQRMFLIEQWSATSKSDSRTHRWHPSMIRLALHIYTTSPAGYEALRDTGVLRLPCCRTLFDYSHAIKAKTGINDGIVELVYSMIEKKPEEYKKYHVLLCDGMHVSQNLAFRKEDGALIGYAHLDSVTAEVARFEKYVDGQEPVLEDRQLASEMLAYMIKGMANSDVKCVVAAFPCKTLTKEMMYKWSWDVIRVLEIAGVKVLAFICDGLGVNRAFFQMHSPISTDTHFNLTFDTINVCSPERRPLYFISDVCHLLKTLRNGFYNSGTGPKKPRLLTINGQTIEWALIVKLYFTYQENNLRKSYKLNAQNVFPTSYSKMKVKYAAQVLSKTVAIDLKALNWENSQEAVNFIFLCNRFFDVLNGAHSSQSGRFNHQDFAAYSSEKIEDERFDWLKNVFLKYFLDWKKQVGTMLLKSHEKEKKMLPQVTLNGLELAIRGIEGATKFYLKPAAEGGGGGPFLMARIFSQDPLEQHFSKQRQGGGGSRAPNVAQFCQKQVSDAITRNLGVRKRGANSTEQTVGNVICDEPLQKRKRANKK